MATQTLKVTGMKCDTCVSNVKSALEQTPGVSEASVDLDSGSARIEHDPQQAAPQQLTEAVRKAGFEAEVA